MRSTKIKSFVSFIEKLEIFSILVDSVVFRGQPIKGSLIPSIARLKPSQDTTDLEQKMLEQLRLQGASMLPSGNETDLDLMITAQHFGLKTRLLDWTSNPLVALWFACSDEKVGDVFVYALEADDLLDADVYKKSPFIPQKTRIIQPRLNNPRIISQQGWFTLHRYSNRAKRFVPLEENPETKKKLHEYIIPESIRENLLIALDRHGVNARTIYPDLGGICRHLNWKNK